MKKKRTKGIGTKIAAIQPNRVLAHLKDKLLYICVVNNGKAVAVRLPGHTRNECMNKKNSYAKLGEINNLLARLWPARADDAYGP